MPAFPGFLSRRFSKIEHILRFIVYYRCTKIEIPFWVYRTDREDDLQPSFAFANTCRIVVLRLACRYVEAIYSIAAFPERSTKTQQSSLLRHSADISPSIRRGDICSLQ